MPGTLGRLPATSRRKVGMTSSPHAPYGLGHTHATMAGTTGCEVARPSQSLKAGPSSDRRLQLACVKPESLVTVDQLREYVAVHRADITAPPVPEVHYVINLMA